MNTFIFCLKIVTFSLLIWIFQCFFNCNSSKLMFNQNIKEEIFGLKYKRALGETSELKNENLFDDIKFIDEDPDTDEALTREQEKVPKIETTIQSRHDEDESDDEENETEELYTFHSSISEKWNSNITQMWNIFCSQTRGFDLNWRARKWYDVWHPRLSYEIYKTDVIIFETSHPIEEKKKIVDKCLGDMMKDFKHFIFQCKEEWNKWGILEAERREHQEMMLKKADDSYEKEKEKKGGSTQSVSESLYGDSDEQRKFYRKLSMDWNNMVASMWKLYILKTKGIDNIWKNKKWRKEWHSIIVLEKTELQLNFIEEKVPFRERISLFNEWTIDLLSRFDLFLKKCIAEWNERKSMESKDSGDSEGSKDVEVD
ncbi:Plasmodium exported protein, unknown function [Plasmodium relictum]|uniref:Uncharacterized protein n=1 Tax=Plasmodium relictum TaxID=85471 RepID=A0A1J1GNE8_PLARL|nr:Plasmodium exported protein, unknown function [Plasmodium relictum]CRG84008.1 Plasmodium exported protein, unknown function [Plasmodium relictum]